MLCLYLCNRKLLWKLSEVLLVLCSNSATVWGRLTSLVGNNISAKSKNEQKQRCIFPHAFLFPHATYYIQSILNGETYLYGLMDISCFLEWAQTLPCTSIELLGQTTDAKRVQHFTHNTIYGHVDWYRVQSRESRVQSAEQERWECLESAEDWGD